MMASGVVLAPRVRGPNGPSVPHYKIDADFRESSRRWRAGLRKRPECVSRGADATPLANPPGRGRNPARQTLGALTQPRSPNTRAADATPLAKPGNAG